MDRSDLLHPDGEPSLDILCAFTFAVSAERVSKMRCVAQERQFRYPADSDKPYIRKWLKPGSGEMYYIRTDRGRHRVSLMALVSHR